MRVASPAYGRVAFLGDPSFEPHVPVSADWAEVRFFPVHGSEWEDAVEAARQWGAHATIVFRPQDVSPELAVRLPGAMKVGVIPAPLFSAEDFRGLELNAGPESGGFRWLTYLESPPPSELARLPLLQVLPLPVDTARFAAGPRLGQRGLITVDWACPHQNLLERIRTIAPVEVLPSDMPLPQVIERLGSAGALLYSSRDALGRFDTVPMLAMAQGLLLISDSTFAPEWVIEPEDEFLPRVGDFMLRAVDEFLRIPEAHKAVRVRAWQKLREAFDASACFKRMLYDASLLASPQAHLARLTAQGATRPVPEAAAAGERSA
jgi:hypothetical protein